MENTAILMFLLMTITAFKGTNSQKAETYRILPFEVSTGLYYKFQGIIRRGVGTWRITSFLNTKKLRLGLAACKLRLEALPKTCQPMLGAECPQLIKSFRLESKWGAAYKVQQEIVRETEELSRRTVLHLPAHLPQGLRRRRKNPDAGILGRHHRHRR